jgi:hypothetical protein
VETLREQVSTRRIMRVRANPSSSPSCSARGRHNRYPPIEHLEEGEVARGAVHLLDVEILDHDLFRKHGRRGRGHGERAELSAKRKSTSWLSHAGWPLGAGRGAVEARSRHEAGASPLVSLEDGNAWPCQEHRIGSVLARRPGRGCSRPSESRNAGKGTCRACKASSPRARSRRDALSPLDERKEDRLDPDLRVRRCAFHQLAITLRCRGLADGDKPLALDEPEGTDDRRFERGRPGTHDREREKVRVIWRCLPRVLALPRSNAPCGRMTRR